MSDIGKILAKYKSVCKSADEKTSELIINVLQKEQELCPGEITEDIHLYLAGNNHLVSDERLTDKDAQAIYKTLANNVYVTAIDLRYNNITDDGIQAISKLVQESCCLKSLNLMNNDFGEKGAGLLAAALHNNETLKILKLNGNRIGKFDIIFYV